MSRGKSTTIDLPTPSARKRAFICPSAATGTAVARVSLATAGTMAGESVIAAAAENDSARTAKARIDR